jgi:hypothetical protein
VIYGEVDDCKAAASSAITEIELGEVTETVTNMALIRRFIFYPGYLM